MINRFKTLKTAYGKWLVLNAWTGDIDSDHETRAKARARASELNNPDVEDWEVVKARMQEEAKSRGTLFKI